MRRGGPERLGEILRGGVVRGAKRARSRLARAREAWARAAGDEIAGHTRVTSFSGGNLHVRVDSSALLSEIGGFLREGILVRLREAWPAGNVLALRLRLEGEDE